MAFLKTLAELALEVLFPSLCFACKKVLDKEMRDAIVCTECRDSIMPFGAFICPLCRARVPASSLRPACHKDAHYMLAPVAGYEQSALRNLIWQIKFSRRKSPAVFLARLLYDAITVLGIDTTDYILIPMPLHPTRLRERGFNQTALLAQELSKLSGMTLNVTSLARIKKTDSQAGMSSHSLRATNMQGAFRVADKKLLIGKKVLLLDDVWTSGATMNQAVIALKDAGVKKIIGLVLAKAG